MAIKKTSYDTCEVSKKPIKNFLNNEVKSYAQYVLRTRTMPSIMDGLRVGARKILYASMVGDLAKKKFVKMPALIGDSLKLLYAHGDASLATTIVNLCTEHTNKYHPLEAIGQIPSLRVPHCDTAVRYLMIRKTPYLDWFKIDAELWNIQEDEGEKIEPTFFLPILPMVLLNRTSAPGFGFSFSAMSYNIDDVIDNVLLSIRTGSCATSDLQTQLRPEIVGIKNENIIFNANKNRWFCVGEYELKFDTDTVIITDLPHNVSFENLEEALNTLKEKFIISGWGNVSEGEKIHYIVKFQSGRMKYLYNTNQWKFFSMLKLYSPIREDILNVIDEDGTTILFYETAHELIDAFVRRRLKYYEKRKSNTIAYLKDQILRYEAKMKFINLVISGELKIFKRKINDIKKDLEKFNLPGYVLDMKFYNITSEEITVLENKLSKTKQELDYIEKTSIQEMYIYDIIDFKNNLGKIQNGTC